MISEFTLTETVQRLCEGDRVILAQAMTLVESQHPRHQKLSSQLLDAVTSCSGRALCLGVTGIPGAGKSTFLDALGMRIIRQGLNVAIIAVDPSSPVSGGSLLGDKTRMTELARSDAAFIRPVPSGGHMGGVNPCTRDMILLCEAASFDVVIVETVGVGQSETDIAGMVDCLILLQIAGTGDDLQGMKKGIMELVDLIILNKDDGENRRHVASTRLMYERLLPAIRQKYPEWKPQVLSCSAREKRGIEEIWLTICNFRNRLTESGQLWRIRQSQALAWLQKQTEAASLRLLFTHDEFNGYYSQMRQAVKENTLSPRTGLWHISEYLKNHQFK